MCSVSYWLLYWKILLKVYFEVSSLNLVWLSALLAHMWIDNCYHRLKLAAMHYNENSDREIVMETTDSDEDVVKLRVEYRKYMQGEGRAAPVRASTTNGWYSMVSCFFLKIANVNDGDRYRCFTREDRSSKIARQSTIYDKCNSETAYKWSKGEASWKISVQKTCLTHSPLSASGCGLHCVSTDRWQLFFCGCHGFQWLSSWVMDASSSHLDVLALSDSHLQWWMPVVLIWTWWLPVTLIAGDGCQQFSFGPDDSQWLSHLVMDASSSHLDLMALSDSHPQWWMPVVLLWTWQLSVTLISSDGCQ